MNKVKKIVCLVSAALVTAGILLAAAGYKAAGCDIDQMNPDQLVETTKEITEPFDKIRISSADIRLLPSDDGACRLEIKDSRKVTYETTVHNGELTVQKKDSRPWYQRDHFFYLGWEEASVRLYLPAGEFDTITVTGSSGDIHIDSSIHMKEAVLEASSGDISFGGRADSLTMKSSSGDIFFDGEAGTASIKASSGDVVINGKVKDLTVETTSGDITIKGTVENSLTARASSGDICISGSRLGGKLSVTTTSGDMTLSSMDAAEIELKATSGDIHASLLSAKLFHTKTSSGDISVPNSVNGDPCNITTTSGDITVQIP